MKGSITIDMRHMPEILWVLRRELARILRDEAETEASGYVRGRLLAVAAQFEAGAVSDGSASGG